MPDFRRSTNARVRHENCCSSSEEHQTKPAETACEQKELEANGSKTRKYCEAISRIRKVYFEHHGDPRSTTCRHRM
jgi:hypothetical protein